VSLSHAPTHDQIEPTSNRQHSPISTLNDHVLLNVFYLYRLHIGDEEDQPGRWDRQRWWYKLAQVSRQWRRVILASPSLLDLHLVCTYGVSVADMLAHSPPLPVLPLTVLYNEGHFSMTTKDQRGVLLAVLQHHRVRRIALRMPAENLKELVTSMGEEFSILERLYIKSRTKERTTLILPQNFQAPNLRHIDLWDVALPMRSPILTSSRSLVYLWLGGIPRSAYIHPNYICTQLSFMSQLETLGIGFHSPLQVPNHDVVGAATITHVPVALPNLRVFYFRGVSDYSEALLARISAPVLNSLEVHFFDRPAFAIPHLLRFTLSSESLNFNAFVLGFFEDFVYFTVDPHRPLPKRLLYFQIMRSHLDQQVAAAVQILGALSPALSAVEKLTLSYTISHRSSERHNDISRIQWREVLRPFSGVKTLHVKNELVGEISRSLRSGDWEPPLELLPNLVELSYSGGDVGDAFMPFINERQAMGHPVHLTCRRR
jgi:hypothetical protein